MATLESLFPTFLYQGELSGKGPLNRNLDKDIKSFSQQDSLGKAWSEKHYRRGYTSYASLSDLHFRSPVFSEFAEKMQPHAEAFAKKLGWEMKGCTLRMTTCWMNVMPKHAYHTLHLHPHSVLSGTYYVSTPKGSVSLKLEDPRMPMYMNAPVRLHGKHSSLYHEVQPKAGSFVLFESWLRHEVPPNQSEEPRISLSFNYELEVIETET